MQITIDELFTSGEFVDIIDEKWVKQFNKNGKLQTHTKKSNHNKIVKALFKCRIYSRYKKI